MHAPRLARVLLLATAPEHRADDLLGDLEETHRRRVDRNGRFLASVGTTLEATDMAIALLRARGRADGAERPPRRPSQALRDHRPGLLDFKLGVRMLLKYPGLTIVGGLAIAFATGLGAGVWEFATDLIRPTMPFDEGDRMVELRLRDRRSQDVEWRVLHDYEVWRDEMRTVEEVGAYQNFQRNLESPVGGSRIVLGAEITAASFNAPRVPPYLGRPLGPADEIPGAPDIAVIGYDLWQRHFGGDPRIVGRDVRLAGVPTRVVGVMPEGYAWPWAQEIWTPFRASTGNVPWGEGPPVQVTARLSPGASFVEANAELRAITDRLALAYPEEREGLWSEVARWGTVPLELTGPELTLLYTMMGLFAVGLVVLISCNLAVLLFARTAARSSEIVVRSALGAGRPRIVAQLFAEAMVLGAIASAMGLWAGDAGLAWVSRLMSSMGEGLALPFWLTTRISTETMVAALLVSLTATALAGIVPALRVTGAHVQSDLQRHGAGTTDLRFGRTWTAVIVLQIAVTVAFVPSVIFFGAQVRKIEQASFGVPADEYLTAKLTVRGEIETMSGRGNLQVDSTILSRFPELYGELKRRLEAEPGVAAVTMTATVPGGRHAGRWFQLDGSGERPRYAPITPVDVDFFDAMGAEVISGRGFALADFEGNGLVALVNPEFVEWFMEGRSPVGRRFALDPPRRDPDATAEGPWVEIVGVVEQLAQTIDPETRHHGGIYVPLGPHARDPLWIAARVGPDPMAIAPRLRELAGEVDPRLMVRDVQPLEEAPRVARVTWGGWFVVLLVSAGVAIVLSTAGMYSIMAFIVSRRRREIGVRVALGANRRRIALGILGRGMRQVAMGIVAGTVLFMCTTWVFLSDTNFEAGPTEVLVFISYLAVMAVICGFACVVPTRRALAIEPTEALRSE